MRIYLSLTSSSETVPFDYQQFLIGAFHKWLGTNELHDKTSLYSLSWLSGGKKAEDGLTFPDGAVWFISSWDEALIKRVVAGILDDPDVCFGMRVNEIKLQEDPEFGSRCRFVVSSPVLIRKQTEDNLVHLTYGHPDADMYLTQVLKTKLKKAGLDYDVSVRFDRSYSRPRVKLVTINGIANKASLCPIIVEGDPEAVAFAWNVGVGHSTGCCFGALS